MGDVIDSDIETHGFSVRTAYYLAYASQCAYAQRGDWVETLGLGDRVRLFTCGSLHGFVGVLGEVALLAFRGTQNVGNCLTDSETPLVTRPAYPGRVHLGFADAVERVWPEIRRLLGTASQTKPLWVTGHSLGGAMATLASLRLAAEGYTVRAVYTYGSPRVGDRRFQGYYDLDHYRFVNHHDLVPHLPFRWCYHHVGRLELLDHEGHLSETQADWKQRKRALAGKAKRVQRAHGGSGEGQHELSDFDWLADHHLDRYVEALTKLLPPPRRERRFDQSHGDLGKVPMPARRPGSAAPGNPRPRAARGNGPPYAISAADFVAAFFDQPQSRCWLPTADHGQDSNQGRLSVSLPSDTAPTAGSSSRSIRSL